MIQRRKRQFFRKHAKKVRNNEKNRTYFKNLLLEDVVQAKNE